MGDVYAMLVEFIDPFGIVFSVLEEVWEDVLKFRSALSIRFSIRRSERVKEMRTQASDLRRNEVRKDRPVFNVFLLELKCLLGKSRGEVLTPSGHFTVAFIQPLDVRGIGRIINLKFDSVDISPR